jgi:hypothetical protein
MFWKLILEIIMKEKKSKKRKEKLRYRKGHHNQVIIQNSKRHKICKNGPRNRPIIFQIKVRLFSLCIKVFSLAKNQTWFIFAQNRLLQRTPPCGSKIEKIKCTLFDHKSFKLFQNKILYSKVCMDARLGRRLNHKNVMKSLKRQYFAWIFDHGAALRSSRLLFFFMKS